MAETKMFKTTVAGVGPFCVEFPDGEIMTTRDEARQRLIAAGEELLAALKAMLVMMDTGPKPQKLDLALSWRDNDDKARTMATTAIAKAEGRVVGE